MTQGPRPSTADADEHGHTGPSRRRLLRTLAAGATLATAGLGGCLGGGISAASDPWREVRRGDPPGPIIDGVARLRAGEYVAIPIRWPESEGSGLLSGRLSERLSLPLDVHTMGAEAYETYLAGEGLDGVSAASATGEPSVSFRETRLPHDAYTMVVDNTRFGREPPYDEITVSVSLELQL